MEDVRASLPMAEEVGFAIKGEKEEEANKSMVFIRLHLLWIGSSNLNMFYLLDLGQQFSLVKYCMCKEETIFCSAMFRAMHHNCGIGDWDNLLLPEKDPCIRANPMTASWFCSDWFFIHLLLELQMLTFSLCAVCF